MRMFLSILHTSYKHLLRLYPRSHREEFAEEMLLDFSDMAMDAGKKGKLSLIGFCLRELIDFPANLLKTHLNNTSKVPNFRRGAGRNILRIAFTFGILLALKKLVSGINFITFTDWAHVATVERFTHLLGWHGSYQDMASILLIFSDLILGPVFVATVLLIIFPELRPIKQYLPGVAIAFALSAIPTILQLTLLQNLDFTFEGTIFAMTDYILSGLGFGIVASITSRERRKVFWLLFAGLLGYLLMQWVSNILTLRFYHEHTIALWRGTASLAMRNLLMGTVLGLLLGIVLEFKKRDQLPRDLSST